MGVIIKAEYVCDFCGKPIVGGDVLVGRLSVRRKGSRGLSRDFELALHQGCSDKLTQHAAAASRRNRRNGSPRAAKS